MRIVIEASFSTDGDYHIDNNYVYSSSIICNDIDIDLSSRKFKIYTRECNLHPSDYDYTFVKVFECEDETYCKMYARDYLEKLFCDIRVSYTHYYIIQDFYEIFDNAIKSIWHEEYFHDSIGGNYNGTSLKFYILKE